MSRQNLEPIESKTLKEVEVGGYFLQKNDDAKINLIATGSEVPACIKASEILLRGDKNKCMLNSMYRGFRVKSKNYRQILVLIQSILLLNVAIQTLGISIQ